MNETYPDGFGDDSRGLPWDEIGQLVHVPHLNRRPYPLASLEQK